MTARISELINRMTRTQMILWLLGLFAFSHAVYIIAGIRFDHSGLTFSPQYLDPELLSTRLLESCFYLHCQPPLFNLFLGSVLKLSPDNPALLFHGIYLVFGLILYCSVFYLQIRLGVSRSIALILSTLFMISPSFVLYEHLLFYTFPVASLLALSAVLLSALLDRPTKWSASCFFGSLLILAGTRSAFHISHYCVVVLALAILWREHLKRLLLPALLPLLLLCALYGKNYVLFGEFGVNSWTGMQLWWATGRLLPIDERERLVAEGKLSELSLLESFQGLRRYPKQYTEVIADPDVPVLSREKKSTGANNYNHIAYIGISEQYFKDFRYVFLHYPKQVAKGVLNSLFDYFKSSADHGYLRSNSGKVADMIRVYDRVFYGKVRVDPSWISDASSSSYEGRQLYLYVGLIVMLPLIFLYALRTLAVSSSRPDALEREQRILLLYICGSILYITLVISMVPLQENNRYRFVTDPLSVVLLGIFIDRLVVSRLWRGRRKSAA